MAELATRLLTPAQIDAYHRDGYLCPIDGLSPVELAQLRTSFEAFEAAQGCKLGAMPRQVRAKTHLLFPWMADLVRHPRILDAVEDLVGPDILVFHLTCWVKEPGDGGFVSWHQDGTYFHLEPAEHVTAWLLGAVAQVRSGQPLEYQPNEGEIERYSRREQARTLARLLDGVAGVAPRHLAIARDMRPVTGSRVCAG